MKKTITVNIGGFSFVINETAYENLQRYLRNVEQKLSGDSDEIMQDIEARIAELLKERLADIREVVDEFDIEYIQSVMGQPEDYAEEGSENETYDTYEEVGADNAKSLYRDMDNAMLGGVCSGLAKYFSIDPLVMRIIFVFFAVFAGSGLLLYIVLLILIPAAKTTAEKLKMSGEAVNLESIKSHFNRVGTDINDKIKSKQFSKKVNNVTNKTVQTVSSIFQIFGKLVGVAFTIAGIVSLIFLILYLSGSANIVPFSSFISADSFYDFLMVIFPSQLLVNMSLISLLFVIGIPLISIVSVGVKLVFGIQTKTAPGIKIAAVIVFGVAFSFLCVAAVRTGTDFNSNGGTSSAFEVNDIELLKIEVDDDNQTFFVNDLQYGRGDFMVITDDLIALKNITLHIEEGSDSSVFEVKTIAKSQGVTTSNATALAKAISFDIQMEGNTLKIPSFSTLPGNSKFRGQRIDVIVKVPEGKSVQFSGDMQTVKCYVNGERKYRYVSIDDDSIEDAIWTSIDGDLECDDCWD